MTPFDSSVPQPEEWRPIPGFPSYEASSKGQIRRSAPSKIGSYAGRVLKQRDNTNRGKITGHKRVSLRQYGKMENLSVHVLVALAFHGPAPSPYHEVAHWDGHGGNNRPENLRWATRRENIEDQYRHGTDPSGERNGRAILTHENVEYIRSNPDCIGTCALAKLFGVHRQTILRVRKGENWKALS